MIMKPKYLSAALLGLSLGSGLAQNQKTLCDVVQAGNVTAARKLIADGASLESRNSKGWTPLIIATESTNTEMVKLLIEKGADVNAKSASTNGSTVLCFATHSDDPEFIDLFLQHRADINARSRNGVTALFSGVMSQKKRAVQFLISKGAKIDQLALRYDEVSADGEIMVSGSLLTPLMCAGRDGDQAMVELLLKSGASLEKRNNYGNNVLMEVAKRPQPQMLKFLIARGANVNAKASGGHTALIYAAGYWQTENVKLLLAAGADPNARWRISNDPDEPGHDATFNPSIWHNEEVVALIREAQRKSNQGASQP